MDCSAPGAHDDIHFTAGSDEYHTDMTDEPIKQLVATNAYDE